MSVILIQSSINKEICIKFYTTMVGYELRDIFEFGMFNYMDAADGYLRCMEHIFGTPDDADFDYAEQHELMPRQIINNIIENYLMPYLQNWDGKDDIDEITKLFDFVDTKIIEYIDNNYEIVKKSMNYL